jgi:hypothetical protein
MLKLSQYFWSLAEQAPSLIAMAACLVFALTRWKRHPKVSLLVALSMALLLVHVFVFLFIYDWIPPLFFRATITRTFEENERIRRIVFLVLGLSYNVTKAVGFAVLLAAIFIQRKPASPPEVVTSGQTI